MPRQNETQNEILQGFMLDDEDREELDDQVKTDDDDVDDDDDDQDADPKSPTGDVEDDDGDDEGENDQKDEEANKQDRFSFKEDRAGNFIDRDGKIVFRAGKQRDLFVKLKKRWLKEEKQRRNVETQFNETIQAAQQLLERYKSLKSEKSYFDDKGLSQDEIKQAADLAVLMKVDPKAGVRKILTMLHMNGTDLKDIGVTGPVDAAEVARIIAEQNKPKEKTEEEKAQEEAENFLKRHPAARQYTGMIAQAKGKFPHMSLDEIWFQMLTHAQKFQNSEGSKKNQKPNKVAPRNETRDADRSPSGKLSLAAVDPSQSFEQIGRDLLRDLNSIEGK